MAKLNVVIPSVDVEVDGIKYRKVERTAKSGDIVKALEDCIDVEAGAFYRVINPDEFLDGDGDDRILSSHTHEVYEKVTEPTATPSAPIKYREVKRKANVGERIKALEGQYGYIVGDELTVTNADRWSDGTGVSADPHNAALYHSEYVVLEPITEPSALNAPAKPERLKVGEYAKVIQERHKNAGKIVKITKDDAHDKYIYRTELINGKSGDIHTPSQVVRATDAEVASAKQALERTKAIGEFESGGYAVVVNKNKTALCGFDIGDYVTVALDSRESSWTSLEVTKADEVYGFCNADALRKITKEEYESGTAKPAPKFEVGEKVRLISGGGQRYLMGFTNGEIYEVARATPDWDGDLAIDSPREGVTRGNAKPSQLEKVSAEEITKLAEEAQWNAIGRKVGEYKAGDVVKYIGTTRAHGLRDNVGIITVIDREPDSTTLPYHLAKPSGAGKNGVDTWTRAESIELIAPVESLFNVTTAGGERK